MKQKGGKKRQKVKPDLSASFGTLLPEIVATIAHNLVDKKDLLNLRLVQKAFAYNYGVIGALQNNYVHLITTIRDISPSRSPEEFAKLDTHKNWAQDIFLRSIRW